MIQALSPLVVLYYSCRAPCARGEREAGAERWFGFGGRDKARELERLCHCTGMRSRHGRTSRTGPRAWKHAGPARERPLARVVVVGPKGFEESFLSLVLVLKG